MAWKKLGLFLIILVIGIVVVGVLFGGERGEQPPSQETSPAGETPQDSEGVGEPTLPAILARLNGSVSDIYVSDGRVYLLLYENFPEDNRSVASIYIYDLDKEGFTDKIVVEEGGYARIPNYQILTVEKGRVYLYSKAGETILTHIPLVSPISVKAGGSFDLKVLDVRSGQAVNSYRLDIEPSMAVISNMIYTYKLESENTLVVRGYNLDSGGLEIEFYNPLDGVDYLSGLYLAYSSSEGGVLTAVFVGVEANYDLERLKVFHITLRYDALAENLAVEVYPVSVYGAYGSIYTSTAYVDGDTYYIFTVYSFQTGNKTVYSYSVESRSFLDGSLLWEYGDEVFFTEKNSSTYIISYVDNGVFYVSWSFFAAYEDGKKLFSVSPWGGIYFIPTLFVVVPAKVYEGGGGFYIVDGDIYVSWIQNVQGSGIKGLKLYKVSPGGLEPVYNLYERGYRGTLFFSSGSKLYFVGFYRDGASVLARLI